MQLADDPLNGGGMISSKDYVININQKEYMSLCGVVGEEGRVQLRAREANIQQYLRQACKPGPWSLFQSIEGLM